MRRNAMLIVAVAAIAAPWLAGCKSSNANATANGGGGGNEPPRQIDPQHVQSAMMAFASRYIAAMADLYERVEHNAKTPGAKVAAVRGKLFAANAAIDHAVKLNPLVGLVDMAVMVSINRQLAQEPWVSQVFGTDDAALIVSTMKRQEDDVWSVAAKFLTKQQVAELREIGSQWITEHPGERYAMNVRLEEWADAKQGNNSDGGLVSGVLSIIALDPFHGLDPAVQEVQRSRVLAERMFFSARQMPLLLAWHVDSLYLQMLDEPQVKQVLANAGTISGNADRFTDAVKKLADVFGRFTDNFANVRVELPQERSTLVRELNDLIATQRAAALDQATTQSAALITRLNSSVGAQQDAMTGNLRAVTDNGIDRLYVRARALVLITVGAILAAFVIYRLVVGRRPARSAHSPERGLRGNGAGSRGEAERP